MKSIISLSSKQLRQQCDPKQFHFKTTDELRPLDQLIGQPRALESLAFGIEIKSHGYNLYACGPPGVGKYTFVNRFIKENAKQTKPLKDWCYLHNFANYLSPIAVPLSAGEGKQFKKDMEALIKELQNVIPALLESEEFQNLLQEIDDEFKEKGDKAYKRLEHEAQTHELALLNTPHGYTVAVAKEGKLVSQDELENLSSKDRKLKEKKIIEIRRKITKYLEKIPFWNKHKEDKQKKLQRDYVKSSVTKAIKKLKKKYKKNNIIVSYLKALEKDVLDNLNDFLVKDDYAITMAGAEAPLSGLMKYQVNLLVGNEKHDHIPIIYEDHPIHRNLVGCFEHFTHMGTLITNFTLIKPGAMHLANGGYLILDAEKMLSEPYAWESIKRALFAKCIKIEPIVNELTFMNTVSITPEPIPLDIKVILIGARSLYYSLCEMDPDFEKLFKVMVDFEEEVNRTTTVNQQFARLIAGIIKKENLRSFDAGAVAGIIDQCSRYADDAQKLSMHIQSVADLVREANFWSSKTRKKTVSMADVDKAILAQYKRVDRMRDHIYEDIKRQYILIDTKGSKVGQVNALSVVDMADYHFGQPSRVTVVTRLGKGDIIDIEREVDLGGAIHSKGVLILSGFFNGRYARNHHLSLSASIVFEQSYGQIDGDSASVAELIALLSSLSEVPVKQNIAITGSINQLGEVQAVGSVNAKIEGFFDICRQNTLTGKQGVVIPKANIKNLMLRKDVVAAVQKKKFHVYAVNTIDQVINILMEKPAGKRNKKGEFPKDTVNYLVEKCLIDYVEQAKEEGKEDASPP